MTAKHQANGQLFVYGTLCVPAVMEALIGRRPHGVTATLRGYARCALVDRSFPGIVPVVGSTVDGLLYADMSARELELIDAFEDQCYERSAVQVEAGEVDVAALTYTVKPSHRDLVEFDSSWALDRFVADFGAAYVRSCAAFRTKFMLIADVE